MNDFRMLLLSTEGNLNDISFDFDHQLKVRNGYVCNSSGYNYGTFKEFFKKDVREYFEEKFSINVVRTHPNAKLPTRGTKYAAGLDLYSIDEINIPGNSTVCVNTGIKIEIPIGQYGRIAERSGLALKGIAVGGGVIDSDYRGEIKVILRNTNVNPFQVNVGDRIGQLIIQDYVYCLMKEKETLDETERGESGFGSTGK